MSERLEPVKSEREQLEREQIGDYGMKLASLEDLKGTTLETAVGPKFFPRLRQDGYGYVLIAGKMHPFTRSLRQRLNTDDVSLAVTDAGRNEHDVLFIQTLDRSIARRFAVHVAEQMRREERDNAHEVDLRFYANPYNIQLLRLSDSEAASTRYRVLFPAGFSTEHIPEKLPHLREDRHHESAYHSFTFTADTDEDAAEVAGGIYQLLAFSDLQTLKRFASSVSQGGSDSTVREDQAREAFNRLWGIKDNLRRKDLSGFTDDAKTAGFYPSDTVASPSNALVPYGGAGDGEREEEQVEGIPSSLAVIQDQHEYNEYIEIIIPGRNPYRIRLFYNHTDKKCRVRFSAEDIPVGDVPWEGVSVGKTDDGSAELSFIAENEHEALNKTLMFVISALMRFDLQRFSNFINSRKNRESKDVVQKSVDRLVETDGETGFHEQFVEKARRAGFTVPGGEEGHLRGDSGALSSENVSGGPGIDVLGLPLESPSDPKYETVRGILRSIVEGWNRAGRDNKAQVQEAAQKIVNEFSTIGGEGERRKQKKITEHITSSSMKSYLDTFTDLHEDIGNAKFSVGQWRSLLSILTPKESTVPGGEEGHLGGDGGALPLEDVSGGPRVDDPGSFPNPGGETEERATGSARQPNTDRGPSSEAAVTEEDVKRIFDGVIGRWNAGDRGDKPQIQEAARLISAALSHSRRRRREDSGGESTRKLAGHITDGSLSSHVRTITGLNEQVERAELAADTWKQLLERLDSVSIEQTDRDKISRVNLEAAEMALSIVAGPMRDEDAYTTAREVVRSIVNNQEIPVIPKHLSTTVIRLIKETGQRIDTVITRAETALAYELAEFGEGRLSRLLTGRQSRAEKANRIAHLLRAGDVREVVDLPPQVIQAIQLFRDPTTDYRNGRIMEVLGRDRIAANREAHAFALDQMRRGNFAHLSNEASRRGVDFNLHELEGADTFRHGLAARTKLIAHWVVGAMAGRMGAGLTGSLAAVGAVTTPFITIPLVVGGVLGGGLLYANWGWVKRSRARQEAILDMRRLNARMARELKNGGLTNESSLREVDMLRKDKLRTMARRRNWTRWGMAAATLGLVSWQAVGGRSVADDISSLYHGIVGDTDAVTQDWQYLNAELSSGGRFEDQLAKLHEAYGGTTGEYHIDRADGFVTEARMIHAESLHITDPIAIAENNAAVHELLQKASNEFTAVHQAAVTDLRLELSEVQISDYLFEGPTADMASDAERYLVAARESLKSGDYLMARNQYETAMDLLVQADNVLES